MALALCLMFDARSDRLVRGIWQRLEEQGVATLQTHTHGRHYPHLSYAVLRRWDLDSVRAGLIGLPDGGAVDIVVQGTVAFPRGRAALACSISSAVAARQQRAASWLDAAGAQLHRHYEDGRWVPHVSVATSATGATLPIVVNTVSDVLPMTLHADRAALIDTATGQQWAVTGVP